MRSEKLFDLRLCITGLRGRDGTEGKKDECKKSGEAVRVRR